MVAAIRRGDTVVTSGGIIGKVTKVEEHELQVEIADGVRIKVLRSTVSEVRGKGEGGAGPSQEPGGYLRTRLMRPDLEFQTRQCCISKNGS